MSDVVYLNQRYKNCFDWSLWSSTSSANIYRPNSASFLFMGSNERWCKGPKYTCERKSCIRLWMLLLTYENTLEIIQQSVSLHLERARLFTENNGSYFEWQKIHPINTHIFFLCTTWNHHRSNVILISFYPKLQPESCLGICQTGCEACCEVSVYVCVCIKNIEKLYYKNDY